MEKSFFIACIGSSAGGLTALVDFFEGVDHDISTAFVVISHLPRHHSTHLPRILSKVTPLKVELLTKSTVATPGHIYILPGNLRVKITDGVLVLRDRLPEEIVNLAIDEFLFSLADDQKEKAIAVILSGMGSDGSKGAKAVQANGGRVFVQSPASAIYNSMPMAVIVKDSPEEVLVPQELGKLFSDAIKSKAFHSKKKESNVR